MNPPQNKPKSQGKPHLLNLTLAGLPELELFESEEQRQNALHEIGREVVDLRSGHYWLAILGLITAVVGGQFLARMLLAMVAWPRWLEDILLLLLVGATFFGALRFLHRSGAAGELRHKLLKNGVPVCLGCGYLLRGLPLDPGLCPECGRPFDDVVREILMKRAPAGP